MLEPINDTGCRRQSRSITASWPEIVRCSKSPAARSGSPTRAPAASQMLGEIARFAGGRPGGEAVQVDDAGHGFLTEAGSEGRIELGELDLVSALKSLNGS